MSFRQLLLARFGGLGVWLLGGLVARAAVVTYHMDLSVPGEFSLFASASADDNFGLACYGLPFDAATSDRITSFQHLSPHSAAALDADSRNSNAGFHLLRTAWWLPGQRLTIAGAQDTMHPTPHLIFGLGQSAGSFGDLGLTPIDTPVQPEWDGSLLLARGTYIGDPSDFHLDTGSVDLLANVFTDSSGMHLIEAEVRLTDSNGYSWVRPPVPDPLPPPPLSLPPKTSVDPPPPVPSPIPPIEPVIDPLPPSVPVITVDPTPSPPDGGLNTDVIDAGIVREPSIGLSIPPVDQPPRIELLHAVDWLEALQARGDLTYVNWITRGSAIDADFGGSVAVSGDVTSAVGVVFRYANDAVAAATVAGAALLAARSAVPEASSLVLTVLAAIHVGGYRRRCRHR